MAANDLARQVLDLSNKFTYATGITPNVVIVGPNVDLEGSIFADILGTNHKADGSTGKFMGLRIVHDDLAAADLSVAYTV